MWRASRLMFSGAFVQVVDYRVFSGEGQSESGSEKLRINQSS